jgi:hypothetical protein
MCSLGAQSFDIAHDAPSWNRWVRVRDLLVVRAPSRWCLAFGHASDTSELTPDLAGYLVDQL